MLKLVLVPVEELLLLITVEVNLVEMHLKVVEMLPMFLTTALRVINKEWN
jgi:hypothetical protein